MILQANSPRDKREKNIVTDPLPAIANALAEVHRRAVASGDRDLRVAAMLIADAGRRVLRAERRAGR